MTVNGSDRVPTSSWGGCERVGSTNLESSTGHLSARFQPGRAQHLLLTVGAPEGLWSCPPCWPEATKHSKPSLP